jgi:hypothetical protein
MLPQRDDPKYVIYAGGAPSMKLPMLAEMFPGVTFVLIDPNEHFLIYESGDMYADSNINRTYFFRAGPHGDIPGSHARDNSPAKVKRILLNGEIVTRTREAAGEIPYGDLASIICARKHKYYIIEDLLTPALARALTFSRESLFISDIRTREESSEHPTNYDLVFNNALIKNCLDIMQPEHSMLKFRVPYNFQYDPEQLPEYMRAEVAACGIDFAGNFAKRRFEYIKPDGIYLQAFAGRNSTEVRLVCSPPIRDRRI